MKTRYILEVKPALPPQTRHLIEDALKFIGFDVAGGGTHTDGSACDISFDGPEYVLDTPEPSETDSA